MLFRQRDKDALLLVVDVLFSRTLARTVAGGVAALVTGWWLAVPLRFRSRNDAGASGTKEP